MNRTARMKQVFFVYSVRESVQFLSFNYVLNLQLYLGHLGRHFEFLLYKLGFLLSYYHNVVLLQTRGFCKLSELRNLVNLQLYFDLWRPYWISCIQIGPLCGLSITIELLRTRGFCKPTSAFCRNLVNFQLYFDPLSTHIVQISQRKQF